MSTDLSVLLDADETYAELERRELFKTSDPIALVGQAARIATELARVVDEKQLYQRIGGKRHVRVEGWTLLGNMLRVYPYLVWSRPIEGGYEARVEARTLEGTVVGAAESQCTRDEPRWSKADAYAIRSMAQTRATSKALKMPLGFVFSMAGYETTPAEEMPHEAEPAPTVENPREVSDKAPEEPKLVAATAEQGAEIATLMGLLEAYDPATDWGAWCREYVGVDSFLTLDTEKAKTLIAGLLAKAEELAPPTEPAG